MKIKIFYWMIAVWGCLFCSCEENKDGYYNDMYRIYFPEETDSLNYSFGDKLVEITQDTVEVPVRIMGLRAIRNMAFKVSVDPASTAKEGIHFKNLQSEYIIMKDSVNGILPIVLMRNELSEDLGVEYKIVLNLEPSADLGLGSKENLKAVITFNNFLEEPEWWGWIYTSVAVKYHPGMYQRLIAYNGGPIDSDFAQNRYLDMMLMFKREVYDYAMQEPRPEETLEWQFVDEDELWWPFE